MGISSRILFVVAASVCCAVAQDDPPGRVGRLTYMNGDVSFRPGDMDDWVAADFNRPLTTGDHLWTDQDARAELHVGSAALRMNSLTAFEFLNLDDSNVQIRLAQGSLSFRVRDLGDQETFEVDTPNLAFSVLRPGEYRIDVDADNQTTFVTVRGGQGEVTGGGQAFTVHPREQAQVSGSDTISVDVAGAPDPDDWDQWCSARNQREDASPSLRYVSREMVGYQDLDDHGSWRTVPDYGAVWVPAGVAADWAPYHNGHWAWVDPWGWTWVDDAPWGFAPFHYGRWVYVGYWAWVPGPIAARPVYAPALVAWVGGGGGGIGIRVGGGPGIGWFPLGPREVYVPSHRVSAAYINRVNVTNTTIVNNITVTNINVTNVRYMNRNAPGAVTAVPQGALASARPVQSVAVRVDARTIQSAQVITTAPVAPSRQSVLGAAPAGRAKQPPAAIQSRPVVAKRAPPPPPVSFTQKQQALASNPGRPLEANQVQQLRSAQPAPRPLVRQAPAARTVNPVVRPAVQAPAARPGGNPPPAAREQARPPQSNDRPPQRQLERPAQTPPPREAQPVQRQPEQREAQPPRPEPREAQRPPERQAEPPRPQPREAQPPQRSPERQAEPQRPQLREAQPVQRPPEREAEPPRPQQREAQPPARPAERPAPKEQPKQEKKGEKKKDEKKQ